MDDRFFLGVGMACAVMAGLIGVAMMGAGSVECEVCDPQEWVVSEVRLLHQQDGMCAFRVDKVNGGVVELTTFGVMPCLDVPAGSER